MGRRCGFSPPGLGVPADRSRRQVPRGGTPRGSWVNFPLSTVSRSRVLYLPFPPVSAHPKSWRSFLRILGSSGEKQVSPAMTRMIRVARRLLTVPLFLEGEVATSRLLTLCRVSWGWGGGAGMGAWEHFTTTSAVTKRARTLFVPISCWNVQSIWPDFCRFSPARVDVQVGTPQFFLDGSKRDLGRFSASPGSAALT